MLKGRIILLSLLVSAISYSSLFSQTNTVTIGASKDVQVWSYDPIPTLDRGTTRRDVVIYEWTKNGAPTTKYGIFDFEFSEIPENAVIVDAKLSLYHAPDSYDIGHSQLSGSNEALIKRVTSNWNETIGWNDTPNYTDVNAVLLPASTSETQDYIDIEVTNLVQDIVNDMSNSYGFLIHMVNQQHYRSLVFASSEHSNPDLHPTLEVTYELSCDTPVYATVEGTVCPGGSYTYADGTESVNIFEDETYTSVLAGQSMNGCDSIVTENVNVLDININDGLVAYYPFSGNAMDATNNGFNGTASGNPTLTTDRFGHPNSAYEFDGIDDYINTFSTFDFSERSLSLWINTYDMSGSGPTAKVAITQDDNALSNGILRVDFHDNTMELWAGGTSGTYASSAVSMDMWMHLVLIRDGGITKYYIDNELVLTSTSDSNGSTYNPVADFIIGAGRATNNQFFNGKIDDIRVYNRAINACEVETLFEEECASSSSIDTQIACDSYKWIDGNTYTESNNSAIHVLINSEGCDSVITLDLTIIDEVAAQPSIISGPNPVCVNSNASYSVVDVPNTVYYWDLPTSWSGTGNDATIDVTTGLNGGTITLVPFNVCGMGIARTLNVTVNDIPVADFTYTENQSEITFSNLSEGADSYYWDFADGENSSVVDPVHDYLSSGEYLVSLTAYNTCGEDSKEMLIDLLDLSFNHNLSDAISIYPNPTEGRINIENHSMHNFDKVSIVNNLGQVVYSERIEGTVVMLDISHLPKGIYMIQLYEKENIVLLRKAIKE